MKPSPIVHSVIKYNKADSVNTADWVQNIQCHCDTGMTFYMYSVRPNTVHSYPECTLRGTANVGAKV